MVTKIHPPLTALTFACSTLFAAETTAPARAFLVLIACLGAVTARGCSIPVFRYALDRWPADSYALEVSPADARGEAVAHFLRNFTDSTPMNLAPVRLKEDGTSRLLFPLAAPDQAPAWSGALDASALSLLTDSPARTELVRRIVDGESGVWVLIESGKREADERASAVLEKRLRYLEQVAQIPEIDPSDPSNQVGPGPALRVRFSVIRVRRDEPAEQPLLKMLAGPENDGAVSTGPWLALVFGRGRVLGAWPAEGFGDEQIDEACLFLLAACSCQVKRMNPGWDLLLNANWNEALQAGGAGSGESTVPPGSTKVASPPPETVTVITSAAPPAAPPRQGFGLAALGALVMLVIGSTLAWATMRKS